MVTFVVKLNEFVGIEELCKLCRHIIHGQQPWEMDCKEYGFESMRLSGMSDTDRSLGRWILRITILKTKD